MEQISMIGYKGVILRNGILRSKYEDIFEVNIPREYQEVDDGIAFSECGYSFCGTVEEVVFHENFICSLKQRRIRDVRLFEIDTLDGKVIGDSYHYKASKIKLVREVPKNEIITYFASNPSARNVMLGSLERDGKNSNFYAEYCAEEFELYRLIEDRNEIEELYVRSCGRLGQKGLCQQDLSKRLKICECNGCLGFGIPLGPKTYEADYLYLLARRKLKMGIDLEHIDEYKELKKRKQKYEVAGLELLTC